VGVQEELAGAERGGEEGVAAILGADEELDARGARHLDDGRAVGEVQVGSPEGLAERVGAAIGQTLANPVAKALGTAFENIRFQQRF